MDKGSERYGRTLPAVDHCDRKGALSEAAGDCGNDTRCSTDHDVFFRVLHGDLPGATQHGEGDGQQADPADEHE